MKTFKRLLLLGFISLTVGILVNQFMNEGIPWRLLIPYKTDRFAKARISLYDAETAYRISSENPTVFIDIRPKTDFKVDRIPGAKNMPFVEYFRKPSRLPVTDKNGTVIVYDFEFGSKRARLFAQALARRGFVQVNILYSGFSGWIQAGLPVEGRMAR